MALLVLLQVVRWLTELTGESPAFEVTAETVDILHDIMVKSELQAKQSRLLCADAERRETEYTNEGEPGAEGAHAASYCWLVILV